MRLWRVSSERERGGLGDEGGVRSGLRPQAEQVLRMLESRRGQTVSKEEFFEAVWPGVFVTDDSLYQVITEIRRVLAADGRLVVETVPKRGYRLVDVPPSPRRGRSWALTAAAVFGLVAAAPAGTIGVTRAARAPAETPVIAILPFASPDGDPRWARIGEGLATDLAGTLARNRWLEVIAPRAARAASEEPETAAARLDARLVLTGTVQAQDGLLRVAAALTTRDGDVVWSERWTREEAELFAVQDEIVDLIGSALGSTFAGAVAKHDLEEARKKPTSDLSAYEHFLIASEVDDMKEEGLTAARVHLEAAVASDPGYANAWAYLSYIYLADLQASAVEADKLWDLATAAARRAYEADPREPDALIRIAEVWATEGKLEDARLATHRAVEIAPNNADVLAIAAWAGPWRGVQGDEQVAWARRAIALSPSVKPGGYRSALAVALFHAGHYGEAVEAFREAPVFPEMLAHRAAAEALTGDIEGARRTAARVLDMDPDPSIDRWLPESPELLASPNWQNFIEGTRLAGLKRSD